MVGLCVFYQDWKMKELMDAIQGHTSPEASFSKLQVYTYGTAAENLALDTFELEISPLEHMPMTDGEQTTNAQQSTSTGTDLSGVQYQTNMTSSGTIKATWLPLGQPNRMTPPNVRRGEEVVVYRFGDVDKFYWVTARSDLMFRRLETVVFAISAVKTEGVKCDKTNTYFLEFSSHKKSITLSTSKANGEPYAYLFTFDLANGKVTLTDDIDNTMFLDSQNHQWHVQNADGSFFDMTKKAIAMSADDSVSIKTKDYSLDASNSITEKTTNRTLTASQNEITATSTHNGNITENGMLELNGDMTTAAGSEGGSGSIRMAGNMTLEGSQTIQGNLAVEGVISSPNQVQAPDPD